MPQVNDDLYVFQLPLKFDGADMLINLSVILDPVHGPTLVDTGLPGQEGPIEEQLSEAGFKLTDLKRIILTHQDIDHIGSLAAIKGATGCRVLAGEVEVPYIEGSKPSPKRPPPERLEKMPQFKAMLENLQRVSVDEALKDGQSLDIAGGVRVIDTPGHTLGHISLYLERTRALITGDALVSEDGQLRGPMVQATPDMESARASVKRLADLDVETIVCYHGGVVHQDANGQLKRVAAELS